MIEPSDLVCLYQEKDLELLAKGGRQVFEADLPTIAGLRHMLLHKAVIRDGEGLIGLVGVLHDVTERRMAEAAAARVRDELEAQTRDLGGELEQVGRRLADETARRERLESELRRVGRFLETLLAGTRDGVSVLAPDMTVISVNQAMRSLYANSGDLVGRKCHEVYHGFNAPCQDCPALRAMATRKLAISVVPMDQNGSPGGWVELFCYPLADDDGTVTGVLEIVRDVTVGRKLEAELAAALERAEAASQAKGAFLASMSHEIRTPLNAVLGYVQLMLGDVLEPRQRERLAVVEESAAALLSIINDILDYSKIEAGRMELKTESFDLRRCLDAVLKEQEVLAREKGLSLLLDIGAGVPETVSGDGLRLRQILRNLVNNAVKYTERGHVSLSVSIVEPDGEALAAGAAVSLRFAVEDTGVGIPAAQQKTIFDSFTQVDGGLTRRQAGTGLGLAICRRLAGLMGGRVQVQSMPGRGSVFWLECPFGAAAGGPESRGEAPAAPACGIVPPRLRILLVEDNRVNRVFASDLLESRGHEVIVAENGRAALEYLAVHPVDVVLMDIQMPVLDGLAATRAIRAGHMGIEPGLPVIGLSAYAMDHERERFLAAGLDDYIIKPIDVQTFFAVVSRVLARRGRAPSAAGSPGPTRPEDVLDTRGIDVQYRGKAGLLTRVGREFVASVPEQLDALAAAMRSGDLAACERVAHTLKGNAAMFGASVMRSLAAEAEQAAASGDADRVRSLAPALGEACRAVAEGMDVLLCRLKERAS